VESDSPVNNWQSIKINENGDRQLAASYSDSVVYSSNGGINWISSNAPSGSYLMVEADSTGQYAILGADAGGGLFYSSDYGVTWTVSVSAGTGDWAAGAVSHDAAYMYAARDDNDYAYVSTDQGVTWTQLTGTGTGPWKALATGATGRYVYLVPSSGYRKYSHDFGLTFTDEATRPTWTWTISTDATGRLVISSKTGGWAHFSDDYLVTVVTPTSPSNFQVNRDWGRSSMSYTGERVVWIADSRIWLSTCTVPSSPPTMAPSFAPTSQPSSAPSSQPTVIQEGDHSSLGGLLSISERVWLQCPGRRHNSWRSRRRRRDGGHLGHCVEG